MFMQYLDATDDLPFLAGRKAKIQFIELHANADRSSILPMQRPRPRLGPAAAASLNKYTPGLVSPPPPHRGGSGGGGCSGGGRGARVGAPPAHRRPTPGDRCRRPDCGPQTRSADDEVVEAASEPPAPHRRGWCRHLRASGGGGEGGGGGGLRPAAATSGARFLRRASRR